MLTSILLYPQKYKLRKFHKKENILVKTIFSRNADMQLT